MSTPKHWQVDWPLIQIQGHAPIVVERTLRKGDVVPDWVGETEIARLRDLGCIVAHAGAA